MPDDPKPRPDAQKGGTYTRAKDFRVVYTNSFRLRIAQGEVAIAFGYQSELANDKSILTDEVEVVMAPLGIKFMVEALGQAVKEMEKQFGPIELPEELKERLAEVTTKPRSDPPG